MKKALIAGLALASLTSIASAGQPTVYQAPAPAPAPCPEPNPCTLEIAAKYGFAIDDIFRGNSDKLDTYGGDLTLVHHFCKRHSLNLRGGYTYGDTHYHEYGLRHRTALHTFYLMPGYRYTHAINDKWSSYLGVNLGATNLSVKDSLRGEDFSRKDHNSEYGFAFSGEVGLRYSLCDKTDIFLAYEFFGSTAAPSVRDGSTHQQTYNVIRTGISLQF